MKKIGNKKVFKIINVLLIVGLVAVSTLLFLKNKDLNSQLTLTTEQKNARLVEEINEVYKLPDEEPVVAVVTNPEEFKDQYPTFSDSQSGDYLLFFRKNRLNVLYRQSEGRVVTTSDVVVPVAVELIGSKEDVDRVALELADFGDQISITKTINGNVNQSLVFDLDSDQQNESKSIAGQLGYDVVSSLPEDISYSENTEVVITIKTQTTNSSTE